MTIPHPDYDILFKPLIARYDWDQTYDILQFIYLPQGFQSLIVKNNVPCFDLMAIDRYTYDNYPWAANYSDAIFNFLKDFNFCPNQYIFERYLQVENNPQSTNIFNPSNPTIVFGFSFPNNYNKNKEYLLNLSEGEYVITGLIYEGSREGIVGGIETINKASYHLKLDTLTQIDLNEIINSWLSDDEETVYHYFCRNSLVLSKKLESNNLWQPLSIPFDELDYLGLEEYLDDFKTAIDDYLDNIFEQYHQLIKIDSGYTIIHVYRKHEYCKKITFRSFLNLQWSRSLELVETINSNTNTRQYDPVSSYTENHDELDINDPSSYEIEFAKFPNYLIENCYLARANNDVLQTGEMLSDAGFFPPLNIDRENLLTIDPDRFDYEIETTNFYTDPLTTHEANNFLGNSFKNAIANEYSDTLFYTNYQGYEPYTLEPIESFLLRIRTNPTWFYNDPKVSPSFLNNNTPPALNYPHNHPTNKNYQEKEHVRPLFRFYPFYKRFATDFKYARIPEKFLPEGSRHFIGFFTDENGNDSAGGIYDFELYELSMWELTGKSYFYNPINQTYNKSYVEYNLSLIDNFYKVSTFTGSPSTRDNQETIVTRKDADVNYQNNTPLVFEIQLWSETEFRELQAFNSVTDSEYLNYLQTLKSIKEDEMVDSNRIKRMDAVLGGSEFAYSAPNQPAYMHLARKIDLICKALGISFNLDGSIVSLRQSKHIANGETIPAGWVLGQFGRNEGQNTEGQTGGLESEERLGIIYEIKGNRFVEDPATGDLTITEGGYVLCESIPQFLHVMLQDLDRSLGLQDLSAWAVQNPNYNEKAGNRFFYQGYGLAQMMLENLHVLADTHKQATQANIGALKAQAISQEILGALGVPVIEKHIKVEISEGQYHIKYPAFNGQAQTIADLHFLELTNLAMINEG